MLVHCAFILTFISFVAPRDNSILPDPLSGECGKIEYGMEHETNNSQTRLGEHPWVVEIIYWYPGTYTFFSVKFGRKLVIFFVHNRNKDIDTRVFWCADYKATRHHGQ